MLPDRTFQIALSCSLAVHAALVVNYANLPIPMLRKKPVMVQIAYLKNPPQLTEAEQEAIKKAPLAKLPAKPSASQTQQLPFPSSKKAGLLTKSSPALKKDPAILKPMLSKPDIIAVKKKITLPPIDMNKINNPSYVSYYQLVREKIRRAAYQNYTRTETGDVYLAFVIASNGMLKDVHLLEDRSSLNYFLREISLRSIRDAAPFPAFPNELDYPQLSFNVIISFEIE